MPLAVAREASVRLIDEAIEGDRLIAVFTQREASVEEPKQEDLYPVGTATHIHKMFKLPDGSLRLIVQGLHAARDAACHPAAPVPARRGRRRARKRTATRIGSRSTPCCATSRPTSSRWCRCRRCCPTISRRLAVEHRRARQAGRLHRLQPVDDYHRREAGSARNARRASAHGHAQSRADQGAGGPRARLEDPVAGPVRGRQEPARVLPPRAAQGDSARARRRRRAAEGNRRAARQDRSGRHAGAGEEGSASRAGSARQDAGRGRRIHRLAHVSRLAGRLAVGEAHR